jgi:serine protease Do
VSKDIADSLGLPKAEGAVVGNVEPDSPAAKAGVEVGDVIQKIDGRTVEGSADLSRSIRAIRPGQKVTLTVWRNGKAREMPVTIAEFKDPNEEPQKVADAGGKGKGKEPPKTDKLGLAVKELTAEDKKSLKIAAGVMVEASDGAAALAQVGPGDVILRINNTEITSVKTFKETVGSSRAATTSRSTWWTWTAILTSRRSGATRSRCSSTASASFATTTSTSRSWMRGSRE